MNDSSIDYTNSFTQIRNGVLVMNPSSGISKNLLQAADELDNAAWVDFSEIRFFLEPAATPTSELRFPVPLTTKEIEMLQAIENEGGDSRNYEEQFYRPFKEAITAGVRDFMLQDIYRSSYSSGEGWTISEDAQSGVITGAFDSATNSPAGTPGHRQDWKIYLREIVESLILFLPYADQADMADSYFSISFLSSSDTWAAKREYFNSIRLHFYFGYDQNRLRLIYAALNRNSLSQTEWMWDVWKALKEELLSVFGTGSEDIGALNAAYTFKPKMPLGEYPFMAFPVNDINLGLRLIYRQEWRPLGIQRGEVVKTIPLGPKQSEKVSTKITRRTKVTKTTESLKSEEMSTETSDTAKDSSEIVREASSAMKWNVNQEVEGGFNCGVWNVGGKTSGGLSGESAKSSKETSTHLTETMQKVANKVRRETKVVVSTESETTFEATSASEIQNPNDEIAITYVFSKLQRQYEILTRLAEVQDVVMVAEELPAPAKVNFDWVKNHDWILAKVLLDESFRDALNSISLDTPQLDSTAMTSDLLSARDRTIEQLGKFAMSPNASASSIDFVEESQKAFTATAKEQLERLRSNYLLDTKRYRLYEHIRENILHYQRAIWQHEDPQQRLLRYRKLGIKVPVDWWFQPDIGGPITIDLFENDSESGIKGDFVADMQQGRMLPLTDLINPAGPIAYYGNYAVYYMRPEYAGDSEIMSLLKIFKSPYIYSGSSLFCVNQVTDALSLSAKLQNDSNPSTKSISQFIWGAFDSAVQQVLSDANATLPQRQTVLVQWLNKILQGASIYDSIRFTGVSLRPATQSLIAENPTGKRLIRLNRQLLEDAYPLYIARDACYGELMDPLQRDFAEENAINPVADATIDQCCEDMIDHVPDLRLKYQKAVKAQSESDTQSTPLDLLGYQTFRDFYPDYQFRKAQSRRFLVDTNCLMIDILPGEGSALEPFKQMHRAIDVLKAKEEYEKLSLQNQQREKSLSVPGILDPDVQKVVVVDSKSSQISIAATGISAGTPN